MSFFNCVGHAILAVTPLIAFATAQTCYFPDGQTVSTDVPCNTTATASSCCPSDSFCMDNGLCFGSGIVSRGSCTDQSWESEECSGYCKSEDPSASISITPCGSVDGTNTFVCGLNSTDCQTGSNTFTMTGGSGFVLRPSQIAALVEPALEASETASSSATEATVTFCPSQTSTTNARKVYTGSDMAGLGCGLGLPLFFALCAALILLRRERQKYAKPKLMYKLPDNCKDEFTFRPPQRVGSQPSFSSPSSLNPSRRQSLRTLSSGRPAHMQNFLERYEAMKRKGELNGLQRHELDSSPGYEEAVKRHELGEYGRISK